MKQRLSRVDRPANHASARPWLSVLATAIAFAFALHLTAPALHAQTGVISGRVVAAGSNEPLSGVEISVGRVGTTSDAEGQFRLSGIPGSDVTLTTALSRL